MAMRNVCSTVWKYRRPLAKAARPFTKVAGAFYSVKDAVRPRRKSAVERHWGKMVTAGAGLGLGYLVYRMARHDENPTPVM
jgi:hypothetical protein